MSIAVSEIFTSIQGESAFAGLPCVFVRLAGCNLDCSYCDTVYARKNGRSYQLDDLVAKTLEPELPLVEITGGEPLIQDQTPALAKALLAAGKTVLVETNGSLDIRCLDSRCVVVMDVKCPGSGQHLMNDFKNLERLKPHHQLKFVISDHRDYIFARDILKQYRLELPRGNVIFSPVHGLLTAAELAAWILADRLSNVRLQVQLHKIIWPDRDRGV